MAVEVCVSESKISRRKSRNDTLYPSCLVEKLQFELSEVASTMNVVTSYVNY